MSLTTTNGKMAVMEWEGLESGFMLSATTPFSQGDKQQLIWGIPEVLWSEASAPTPTPAPVTDITPEGAGGAGYRAYYDRVQQKKRQAIIQEEEEIMRMVAMAFPELIKHYRK